MNEEKFRQAARLRGQIRDLEERLEQFKLLPDGFDAGPCAEVGLYTEGIICIRANEDLDFYREVIAQCIEKTESLLEEKKKLYEEL